MELHFSQCHLKANILACSLLWGKKSVVAQRDTPSSAWKLIMQKIAPSFSLISSVCLTHTGRTACIFISPPRSHEYSICSRCLAGGNNIRHESIRRLASQSNSWVGKWVVCVSMGEMDASAGEAGGNISPAPDPVEVSWRINYSHAVLACWEEGRSWLFSPSVWISDTIWCFFVSNILFFFQLLPKPVGEQRKCWSAVLCLSPMEER